MSTLQREPAGTAPAAASARERAGAGGVVAVVPGAADRAAVLAAFAEALGFPSYFGHNLDALEECLHDLSWLPAGPVELVWEDGPLRAADPATHATLLSILADAPGTPDRPLRTTLAGPQD